MKIRAFDDPAADTQAHDFISRVVHSVLVVFKIGYQIIDFIFAAHPRLAHAAEMNQNPCDSATFYRLAPSIGEFAAFLTVNAVDRLCDFSNSVLCVEQIQDKFHAVAQGEPLSHRPDPLTAITEHDQLFRFIKS